MAIAFSLIDTVKRNNFDPKTWLPWLLAQITDHKITRLDGLLPWRYAAGQRNRLNLDDQTERVQRTDITD